MTSPIAFDAALHLPSVEVECNGLLWLVSPRYYPGVSLQEALDVATAHGCTLPSKALVDALYAAADCKLDASKLTMRHDGTPRTMAAPALVIAHLEAVERAIDVWSAARGDRAPALVAGSNKDVILNDATYTSRYGKIVPAGALGIYGWQIANGTPIQGANFVGAGPRSHVPTWRDYSQGARLVRLLPATC